MIHQTRLSLFAPANMTLETIATMSDDPIVSLPAVAS
jgi:hypothetical protein